MIEKDELTFDAAGGQRQNSPPRFLPYVEFPSKDMPISPVSPRERRIRKVIEIAEREYNVRLSEPAREMLIIPVLEETRVTRPASA